MNGASRSRSDKTLWRHRNFMLLWAGQTVSEIGSAITVLALPLTAVVTLHVSTLQVGLLSAATTAAWMLVALPAGVLVDKFAKRTLMLSADIARMLLIGSIPLAAFAHLLTVGQLYSVALLVGIATVIFTVSYQSYVPMLVSREQLVDANGKLATSQEAADLIGPGLGGGLVGLLGAAGAMIADTFSYAASIGTLLLIKSREPPRERGSGFSLRELMAGLSFVFKEPVLRKTAECTAIFNLCTSLTVSLEIIFLVRVLHVRPAYTGLVVAVSALGGVVGGAVSGRLSRLIGSVRIIWVSVLGFGLIGLLLPLAQPGWGVVLFIAGSAGQSFTAVIYTVAQVSYRQAVCPPTLLGRMNAAMRWVMWGLLPIGGVLAGVLGSTIGIRSTLWIGTAGAWAAGILLFFSPLRSMRDQPDINVNHVQSPATDQVRN